MPTPALASAPRRLLARGALLACAFALGACQCVTRPARPVESTAWLPRHEFQRYLAQKDQKAESGKNFWDLGHSVGKLESRWKDGYQQYRVEIVENPKDAAFWWMWYFDMDQATFQKRLSELSVQGYQLVSHSHNLTPAGGDSYGAVWNKKRTRDQSP